MVIYHRVRSGRFSLLRGSGLKFELLEGGADGIAAVLPLTREWIEIDMLYRQLRDTSVLPLTREWIEIRTEELKKVE